MTYEEMEVIAEMEEAYIASRENLVDLEFSKCACCDFTFWVEDMTGHYCDYCFGQLLADDSEEISIENCRSGGC